MRFLYAFLRAIDHSTYLLIASVAIGLLGVLIPENIFVHFGVHTHDLLRIALGLPLIIIPIIIHIKRTIGILRKKYPFEHFLSPPRELDFSKFAFRVPRSDEELAAFVKLSDEDKNTGDSYKPGTIDRKRIYSAWRFWRPDAFMALIKADSSSVSASSVLAISIILPLTADGISFFDNNGRARDLEAHHIAATGKRIEGLLLDTWIVQPRGIVEIGKTKRVIREEVAKHQNALYLLHMSLFWRTSRHITIIHEASNTKLVAPLLDKGFSKIFPLDKSNKHYHINLRRSDFIDNSFAFSILRDLKRLYKFKDRI
jgi:hypothetical protein